MAPDSQWQPNSSQCSRDVEFSFPSGHFSFCHIIGVCLEPDTECCESASGQVGALAQGHTALILIQN
jgi:hypothetical protein